MLLAAATTGTVVRGQGQAPPPNRSITSMPERLAEMRHHFVEVTVAHEALIRGDLAAVREPARELSVLPIPPRVPASAGPYVALIRDAGRRTITAPTLTAAALEVSTMLSLCGDCHRSVGISPVPTPGAAKPDVGGIVGHMLEHQRAADDLLRGLVIPSTSEWTRGAGRLAAAPLHNADLLPDRRMTDDIRKAESRVHALADRAAKAGNPNERAAVYGELLGNCAQCHGLHRLVWGPRSTR
jgi:mono/diheme cytochrome c family protein